VRRTRDDSRAPAGPLLTLLASFAVAGPNFVLTVAGLIAMSGSALPVVLLLAGPAWVVARAWRRTRAVERLPRSSAARRSASRRILKGPR
jgi:hypothetical protein